ncbi:hypothetical protein CKJ90_32065, partial [Klebsiella pneumoniae]
EPLGVVAGIGAWNYPIQIACGNRRSAGRWQCDDFNRSEVTRCEPLGVVAGIGAWNYPIQIACGNRRSAGRWQCD